MSNIAELTEGLFTVICDSCGITFKAENLKCSCGLSKGTLNLNIDEMLSRIYALHASDNIDDAADIIFEVYYHLHDKFHIMNNILEKVDESKLD